MLVRLVQGEASVNELAEPFNMSLPAVSKHIKVLEKAGLLIKTRQAQQRLCKIDGAQLKQAVDWIEQYRQLWEGRLDRLDACLLELHVAESAAKPDTSKPVKPGRADKPAQSAVSADQPKCPQRPIRNTPAAKEKKNDSPIQQQIGFDF
jgi:biotin operon repressor